VKNSNCQQFDPLRNAQPVKSGQRVSDVIENDYVIIDYLSALTMRSDWFFLVLITF